MEFVIAAVLLSALLWGVLPRYAHRTVRVQARAARPATRNSREAA
ncbi:MAG TPA: hypothetical protein VK165_01330 [Azonexus sp.]|nr:hypothetical protein [Azonexus sp.]